MTNTVYLICGVPGAGKTWVAKQLTNKFNYLAHDDHLKDFINAVVRLSRTSIKPIITECPFAERETKSKLEMHGLKVVPVFIIERPDVIRDRYKAREGKDPTQASMTRAITIRNRAKEWNAQSGTSREILSYLEKL